METPAIKPERKKNRSDFKIARLTLDQRDAVRLYCETVSLDEGARWLAEHFNIHIASRSLEKWLQKETERNAPASSLRSIRDNRDRAMLVGKVIGSATQITDANSVLIAQAIFEEFGKPAKERDETRLVKYMDLALKAKAQELRDKSNALATRRFFFDATKSALRELARLQKISDGPGDEREKIEKAMRILFGEEPRGFIPPTEQEAA